MTDMDTPEGTVIPALCDLLLELIADGDRLGHFALTADLEAVCKRTGYASKDITATLEHLEETEAILFRWEQSNYVPRRGYALAPELCSGVFQTNAPGLRAAIVQHLVKLGPCAKTTMRDVARALAHRARAEHIYRTLLAMEAVGRILCFDPPRVCGKRTRIALNVLTPKCSEREIKVLLGEPITEDRATHYVLYSLYDHRSRWRETGTAGEEARGGHRPKPDRQGCRDGPRRWNVVHDPFQSVGRVRLAGRRQRPLQSRPQPRGAVFLAAQAGSGSSGAGGSVEQSTEAGPCCPKSAFVSSRPLDRPHDDGGLIHSPLRHRWSGALPVFAQPPPSLSCPNVPLPRHSIFLRKFSCPS
ncbi:MAG: hypothetical protein KGJ57_18605 [Sphingomonadales bacterium]|nr:hypothetical protein [Sphingomonadales bacterium]MDE2171409.1 hypothetical protein [Sphingomonadales bacterium]